MTEKSKARLKAEKELAALVAKNMPDVVLREAFEEVAEAAFRAFSVDNYAVRDMIKELVNERAKALLKTKYAAKLEEISDKAALDAVTAIASGRGIR